MKNKQIGFILIATLTIAFVIYYFYSLVSSRKKLRQVWNIYEKTKSASDQEIVSGRNITRSNDGRYGIEFSYSMWIYIDGWDAINCGTGCSHENADYHILNRGDRKRKLHGQTLH